MGSEATQSAAPVHRFILLTDIAQSSRLAEQYGPTYLEALEQHNQLVRQAVAERSGEIYKQTGDGYLVLFETAESCLETALELGSALEQLKPLAEDDALLVRLALHAGSLQPSGKEYFGPALNRVSRICQVCNPGQVLVSAAVGVFVGGAGRGARQKTAGRAARATNRAAGATSTTEFQLIDLGQHHLRDLAEPEQLYQLDSERFSHREFPPLSTLDNRPNNLVRQPNHFIGREKELKELADLLLDDTYLLSVVAPGGYGKSRLAAQLCANLLHRFEHGVFMAYLAPVRESLGVPTEIANALGFQFSGSREPEEQLCDYLREKELLLCLDNFEHVLDCAVLVRRFLDAAPKLKIVTTSREPLRIKGERIFVLEPLAVDSDSSEYTEAEQLFSDRAQLVMSSFSLQADNHALVQEICSKLSGIPLAIELAAAWMDGFTLSELSEELSQQLELESRESDAEPRHQSLKASLDWSWNLLGEEQQAILMKLSTFRGGFFSEAASELLGLKGMALRRVLLRVADKSWLYTRDVSGRTRFFLRDMLAHEYALSKLQESELYEPAVMAHAAYFSALMAREGPRLYGDGTPTGQSEALATLRLEQQNIEEALDTLLKRLKPGNATDVIAALLLPIANYLRKLLGMAAAFRKLVERYEAIKRVAEQQDSLQQVLLYALQGCSRGQIGLGDYDAAHDDAKRATILARTIGDRKSIAGALASLGLVENRQGNHEAAREPFAESLAIGREIGDRYEIARSFNGLGHIEFRQGNYSAALELYADSLVILREIGDRYSIGISLNNLGLVEFDQGNFDAARELYAESLAIDREIGDRQGVAGTLNNLGIVEKSQGNYAAARKLHAESLAIRREIGSRLGIAGSLNNLGVVEHVQGNYDAARRLYAESLAIKREIGNRRGEASSLHGLAVVHYALEAYTQAVDLLSQALAIRREIGDRSGICEGLAACASLLAACDLLPQSAMCLYGARHHAAQVNYRFYKIERELLERASEMVEHPDTGLAAEEREQLQAQAEAMSLDELAEFALAELEKLQAGMSADQDPA